MGKYHATRCKPVRPIVDQANYSSAQTGVCANEFGTSRGAASHFAFAAPRPSSVPPCPVVQRVAKFELAGDLVCHLGCEPACDLMRGSGRIFSSGRGSRHAANFQTKTAMPEKSRHGGRKKRCNLVHICAKSVSHFLHLLAAFTRPKRRIFQRSRFQSHKVHENLVCTQPAR